MTDHVYKKIEVVGTSQGGVDEAINNAVTKASKTVHHMRWFEVSEIRGRVDKGTVAEFQVTLRIGFRLDE